MTKTAIHRITAALLLPRHIADEVQFGQGIITAMTGNPNFPTPNPVLTAFTTVNTKLDAAETAAKTRAKGTIPARDAVRIAWIAALHAVRAQVQSAADANPDQAEAIITSANLSVTKAPVRAPKTFGVKQTPVSGAVRLVTKSAGPRATYFWEYSVDGGKTWIDVPPTMEAKTSIAGLPVATAVQFRFRTLTKAGQSDWSQPLALLVK